MAAESLKLNPDISIRVLDGFDDSRLDEAVWKRLLDRSETETIFQTQWWQKAWWDTFGRGQLFLLGVFRGERLVGLSPMFTDGGMVFFTGSGGSDYLDFIGEATDHGILAALLAKAMDLTPGFVGFRFYHIPERSRSGTALQKVAETLGLNFCDEGEIPAPAMDLDVFGVKATRKKSLVRHQRYFEREGNLSVLHRSKGQDILPRLDVFFEQHIARWAVTPYPSLFLDPTQRQFYEALARSAETDSWLRFTEIRWNDSPIAFHFGFKYGTTYMWYKPSFEIDLSKRSPGEVLIRNLIMAALNEGAVNFDLGLGAETFKQRFATHTPLVRTLGLYPSKNTDSLST